MNSCFWIMLSAAMIEFGVAQATAVPNAASVGAQIDATGAKQTIAALSKAGQWDAVIDKVGTGNPAWVSLATRLAPGSDAGTAEDLGIGLAYALPHNPASVLAAIGPNPDGVLGVHRVCGVPFIEMAKRDVELYLKRALLAVGRVTAPGLRGPRNACLAALRS